MLRATLVALMLVAVFSSANAEPGNPDSYGPPQKSPDVSAGNNSEDSIELQQPAQSTQPNALLESDAQQANNTLRRPETKLPKDNFWALNLSDVLLAVFTALLVVVGGMQAAILRRTNQQAARIERAYVFTTVKFLKVMPQAKDLRIVLMEVNYRNHGKTPALLRRLRGYAVVQDDYPDKILDLLENPDMPPGITISAGEKRPFVLKKTLTKVEWENVQGANTKLLCIGEVCYADMLGKRRQTGFCWEYQHTFGGRFEIAPPRCTLNHHT